MAAADNGNSRPMTRTAPLVCHPNTPADWLDSFQVALDFAPGGSLKLSYELIGDLRRLKLPETGERRHTDDLWQHTCCEAFLVGVDAPAYREFNFSPSRAWAAYLFSAYRQDAQTLEIPDPAIHLRKADGRMLLTAVLAPGALPPGKRLQIGLSAVIEDRLGSLSYWALHHAAATPDFHDADSQILDLEQP